MRLPMRTSARRPGGTGLVFDVSTPLTFTLHFRPIGMQGIGTQLLMKQ